MKKSLELARREGMLSVPETDAAGNISRVNLIRVGQENIANVTGDEAVAIIQESPESVRQIDPLEYGGFVEYLVQNGEQLRQPWERDLMLQHQEFERGRQAGLRQGLSERSSHNKDALINESLEMIEQAIMGEDESPVEAPVLTHIISNLPGEEFIGKAGKRWTPFKGIWEMRGFFKPEHRAKVREATQTLKDPNATIPARHEAKEVLDTDQLRWQYTTIQAQARAALSFWARWYAYASEILDWYERDAEGVALPPKHVVEVLRKRLSDKEAADKAKLGVFGFKVKEAKEGLAIQTGVDDLEVRINPFVQEGAGVETIYATPGEQYRIEQAKHIDDWIREIDDE